MTSLNTTLHEHGYNNWVKGALSLGIARDGIENFIELNTDKYHLDVINSLHTGVKCSTCSTENVIPCRNNNNFCKFVNRSCKIHDRNDPNKVNRNCPNHVCDKISKSIMKEHRFNGPAWRNTDCHRWCREPWELAKCFMSQGYESSKSAADTDFPGLLSVIINSKLFDNKVTDNLSSRNNIFCQARDIRNKILHKADMKLTDQELYDYVAILNAMLTDSKCLAVHPDANKSKIMLDKILKDKINITTEDERQVRALRDIELKKREALASIAAKTDDAAEQVRKKMKIANDEINIEMQDAIDVVKKVLADSKDDIKVEKDDAILAVNKEMIYTAEFIKEKEKDAMAGVRQELTEAKYVIKVEKEEAISALQTAPKDIYNIKKKELKEELISVYQEDEQLSAPIPPLVHNDQTKIDEMYVKPNMKIADINIESYKDLFKDGRKKIYVVGDAGTERRPFVKKWFLPGVEYIQKQ